MSFSDHRPGILHFGSSTTHKSSFKISNYLLDHPKYMDTLTDFWNSKHFAGSAQYCLVRKLMELKKVLKSFNQRYFSDLEIRVAEAHKAMLRSQEAFLANPSTQAAREQKKYQDTWWKLASAEDKWLKQRARIKWIKDGDHNTSFFHRSIQARKARNHIHYLEDQGIRLTKREEIIDHSIGYFSNILGRVDQPFAPEVFNKIKALTKFKCDGWLQDFLESDVTDSEIKNEVFALPKKKCPGPDGFNAEFYIKSWPVIGEDFSSAVREFFNNGQLLKQINATNIVLIPKSPGADNLKDFRPISLCNVLYKIISKILARRLQVAMPTFISSNQAAFVKGRSLVENVILATELVKGFGTKASTSRGALKVDLSKAFDTLRWDFLLDVLRAAEFPPKYINWIRECISTTSFAICLNGEPCGYFKGGRGLRQGDPLSPSLFIIAMEVFGELLRSEFHEGRIKHHDLCRKPLLTHLSFADDVMIFFDGSSESLKGIKTVFNEFQIMSGLTLNMHKTTAFVNGLSEAELLRIANIGFKIGELPVRYLGLPLLTRKMRKSDYSPLLDAISRKFNNWTVRPLSFSGRLQLLLSVIYSITNFWMGAFLLPKGCIREITKICCRFLWSGTRDKVGIAKVAWKSICLPKKEGGLGLRDFSSWNITLQLKLLWALLTKEESLWVAWVKEHWLKRTKFWTAQTTSSTSWVWRSLIQIRPLVNRFVSCKLGNGLSASFWHDNWSGQGALIHTMGVDGPQKLGLHRDATVADACEGNNWHLPNARTRCSRLSSLRSLLLNISTPSSSAGPDRFYWGDQSVNSTRFSTKKAWDSIRPRKQIQEWTASVWTKSSTPKHSFLLWVTILNRLPLRTRLRRWGLNVTDNCCICSRSAEDRDHLFLKCEFVLQIWDWLALRLGEACDFNNWSSFIEWISNTQPTKQRILKNIASQAIIYTIWKERNSRLHNATSTTASSLISVIDKTVRATILAFRSRRHHQTLLSLWFSR